jgi:hypothetical protein
VDPFGLHPALSELKKKLTIQSEIYFVVKTIMDPNFALYQRIDSKMTKI